MSLNSLQDLFVEQLKDLYSAEQQFAEAQTKVAGAISDSDLKEGVLPPTSSRPKSRSLGLKRSLRCSS